MAALTFYSRVPDSGIFRGLLTTVFQHTKYPTPDGSIEPEVCERTNHMYRINLEMKVNRLNYSVAFSRA